MNAIQQIIQLHSATCTDPDCDLSERAITELSKMRDITPIIDSLNDAFQRDPVSMRTLITNVTYCYKSLAEHPTIQVSHIKSGYTVSALGLVNGVLGAAGLPLVASKWTQEVDEQGRHGFLGFCEYKP